MPRQTRALHLFAGVMTYAFHQSKYRTQNLYDCLELPSMLLYLENGVLTSMINLLKYDYEEEK